MSWFVQFNYFKSKNYLPKPYELLVKLIEKVCISNKKEKYTQSKRAKNSIKTIEIDKNNISTSNSSINQNTKKAPTKNVEKRLEILNHFVFIVMFFIVLLIQLLIWCS